MKTMRRIDLTNSLVTRIVISIIGLLILLFMAALVGGSQSGLQLARANPEDTITPTPPPTSMTNTVTSTPTQTCEVGWRVVDSPDVGSNDTWLKDITAA